MSHIRLTGPCTCGHTPDDPNEDCERCMLVQFGRYAISQFWHEWLGRWEDGDLAQVIANRFGLDLAEVRQIVGLDPASAPIPAASVAGVGVIDEEVA